MASADPNPKTLWKRAWNIVRNVCSAGTIIASVGWYVSYRNSCRLAIQAQDLSRVNLFQDTGIAVDQAFADINDAAARGNSLSASKLKLDQAVRAHASQTDALRDVVSSVMIDQYLDRVTAFREIMEKTQDATHLNCRLTAFSAMKVERDHIVAAAKQK